LIVRCPDTLQHGWAAGYAVHTSYTNSKTNLLRVVYFDDQTPVQHAMAKGVRSKQR